MKESGPDEISVRHNSALKRFEIEVQGARSILEYVRRDREMVVTHTFVPPELRGRDRGLAEKLVRAALEHARVGQLRVVPACSYVERFIGRHPEFQSLLG
ncbi:MAG: N-acetyltransferase [Opitutus sp.]|nr:N-acetyltransferase [Opitutus sp.]